MINCVSTIGTLVSSTNKTDRHNIAEILLKVTSNTTNHKPKPEIHVHGLVFYFLFFHLINLCIFSENVDIEFIYISILTSSSFIHFIISICASVGCKINAPLIEVEKRSFSGGRSRSTLREPPTMGKHLVNFITCCCESRYTYN